MASLRSSSSIICAALLSLTGGSSCSKLGPEAGVETQDTPQLQRRYSPETYALTKKILDVPGIGTYGRRGFDADFNVHFSRALKNNTDPEAKVLSEMLFDRAYGEDTHHNFRLSDELISQFATIRTDAFFEKLSYAFYMNRGTTSLKSPLLGVIASYKTEKALDVIRDNIDQDSLPDNALQGHTSEEAYRYFERMLRSGYRSNQDIALNALAADSSSRAFGLLVNYAEKEFDDVSEYSMKLCHGLSGQKTEVLVPHIRKLLKNKKRSSWIPCMFRALRGHTSIEATRMIAEWYRKGKISHHSMLELIEGHENALAMELVLEAMEFVSMRYHGTKWLLGSKSPLVSETLKSYYRKGRWENKHISADNEWAVAYFESVIDSNMPILLDLLINENYAKRQVVDAYLEYADRNELSTDDSEFLYDRRSGKYFRGGIEQSLEFLGSLSSEKLGKAWEETKFREFYESLLLDDSDLEIYRYQPFALRKIKDRKATLQLIDRLSTVIDLDFQGPALHSEEGRSLLEQRIKSSESLDYALMALEGQPRDFSDPLILQYMNRIDPTRRSVVTHSRIVGRALRGRSDTFATQTRMKLLDIADEVAVEEKDVALRIRLNVVKSLLGQRNPVALGIFEEFLDGNDCPPRLAAEILRSLLHRGPFSPRSPTDLRVRQDYWDSVGNFINMNEEVPSKGAPWPRMGE